MTSEPDQGGEPSTYPGVGELVAALRELRLAARGILKPREGILLALYPTSLV